jgi:hypothetical protein
MYAMAKKRVADAERELESVVVAPGYKRNKAAACIVLGLWLGVVAAILGQLQLFAMLGVSVFSPTIDVLFAGLTAGALSRPIHCL